jgi:hypothetical protein
MKKALIALFTFSLLLAFIIFLPYTGDITHRLPNAIDPVFYAWNIHHNAYAIFQGFNFVLDTNTFYPLTNTLAYSDTLWGQSPITSVVIWITHNPIFAENIAIIVSFPFAAGAMYLLSFYLTKNIPASILSGLFFAFCYPRLSQIGHLPTVFNFWLPLFILDLLKFLHTGTWKHLVLFLMWYIFAISSSIYFGVFLIPTTAVILTVELIRLIKNKKTNHLKMLIGKVAILFLPFICTLSIFLFPYIRLKAEHPEIKRSIDEMTYLRATPIDYISVLPTSTYLAKFLPNSVNEHVLFPTLTLMTLSLLGLILSIKKRRYYALIFGISAFVSFILSLGNEQSFSIGPFSTGVIKMPYYYLYHAFPVFQVVRVPARLGIFVILAMSALAAIAIAQISKIRMFRLLVAICACVFFVEIWQTNTPFITMPKADSLPEVYTWLKKQPPSTIIAEVPQYAWKINYFVIIKM